MPTIETQALRDWDITLFDAGRTLIQPHPGLRETILAYSEHESLGLSLNAAERAADSCRAWADAQSLREYRGQPFLAHGAFLAGFYRAGIAAALPGIPEPEAVRLGAGLTAFSEQVRRWTTLPGARETLELFRRLGRRAGLVSNFSAALRDILASLSMDSLLDPVVISGEVGIEKPDPRIMRLACDRAGVGPERTVYVGDHPLDVVCARSAGVRVVWVTDPARGMPPELGVKPDLRAASISDVPALLGLG